RGDQQNYRQQHETGNGQAAEDQQQVYPLPRKTNLRSRIWFLSYRSHCLALDDQFTNLTHLPRLDSHRCRTVGKVARQQHDTFRRCAVDVGAYPHFHVPDLYLHHVTIIDFQFLGVGSIDLHVWFSNALAHHFLNARFKYALVIVQPCDRHNQNAALLRSRDIGCLRLAHGHFLARVSSRWRLYAETTRVLVCRSTIVEVVAAHVGELALYFGEFIVAHPRERWHKLGDLQHNRRRRCLGTTLPKQFAKPSGNLPRRERFAHWTLRRIEPLYAPFAVGKRTVTLGKTPDRQRYCRHLSCAIGEQAQRDDGFHFIKPLRRRWIVCHHVRLCNDQHFRRVVDDVHRVFRREAHVMQPHAVRAGEGREQAILRTPCVTGVNQERSGGLHQRAAAVERQPFRACDDDQVRGVGQLLRDFGIFGFEIFQRC